MTVIFSKPTAADIEPYEVGGYADYYTHHIKVTATDEENHSAFVLIPPSMLDRLGKSYIESHARLHYEPFFEEWFLTISQNDFYNDLQRNPEKVIPVRFIQIENGTGREVYQGTESGKYYLRENYAPREQCARWNIRPVGLRFPCIRQILRKNPSKSKTTSDKFAQSVATAQRI